MRQQQELQSFIELLECVVREKDAEGCNRERKDALADPHRKFVAKYKAVLFVRE
jgi:hypothetical protein